MVDFADPYTYIPVALIILAPIIGGILMGIDRKLTARMQSRMGPPIVQPFYDAVKLWGKEPFITSQLQPILAFLLRLQHCCLALLAFDRTCYMIFTGYG
jgi:ech hydrogenase subunit B